MSINALGNSSPIQNHNMDNKELTSSKTTIDVIPKCLIKEIFNYLTISDVIKGCSSVNKEWKIVSKEILNQIEDPLEFKYPIYTRQELLEKFKECVNKMTMKQQVELEARYFVKKSPNNLGKEPYKFCPLLKCDFIFKYEFFLLGHPPIIIKAYINEILNSPGMMGSSTLAGSSEMQMEGRTAHDLEYQYKSVTEFAPKDDLMDGMEKIVLNKITQEDEWLENASKGNSAVEIISILSRITCLYILLWVISQSLIG